MDFENSEDFENDASGEEILWNALDNVINFTFKGSSNPQDIVEAVRIHLSKGWLQSATTLFTVKYCDNTFENCAFYNQFSNGYAILQIWYEYTTQSLNPVSTTILGTLPDTQASLIFKKVGASLNQQVSVPLD